MKWERELGNDAEELRGAARDAHDFLERAEVGGPTAYAVDTAIEELATNVIRHGFDEGRSGRIRIAIETHPAQVVLVMSDDARPFDPTRVPEPENAATLDETPLGGLGISMVRKLASEMSYARTGSENRVELRFRRRGPTLDEE